MTITEFLTARLDEDEAVARAAQHPDQPSWEMVERDLTATGRRMDVIGSSGRFGNRAGADHVVRWQPARVLAEVEAKRRIVEYHYSWSLEAERNPETPFGPILQAKVIGAEAVLRALAMPYADHPDYDEAWRP